MEHLVRLWRGELDLGRAFWRWLVGAGLLVNTACTAAAMAVLALGPDGSAWPPAAAAALHLAAVPFNAICLAGVWRAAAVVLFLVYVVW